MVRSKASSAKLKQNAPAAAAAANGGAAAAAAKPAAEVAAVVLDEKDTGIRLVMEVLGVPADKVKVEVKAGHGTPTAKLPSGAQVTGAMTLSKYFHTLSTASPDLLGTTDADKAEVEAQVDAALTIAKRLVPENFPASEKDRERIDGVLAEANAWLAGRVFAAGKGLTVADLFWFGAVYVSVATMPAAGRLKFSNVTRYFDLIQNLIAELGKPVHLAMVDIDLEYTAAELEALGVVDTAAAGKKEKTKEKKGVEAPEAAAKGAKADGAAAKKEGKKGKGEPNGATEKAAAAPAEKGKGAKAEKGAPGAEKKAAAAPAEKPKAEAEAKGDAAAAESTADLPPGEPDKLDLRVGKIISVQRHAQADTLYVEQVDLGEDKPRTVVSGLVKYMKESDLQDRLVVLLCNLKPQKMRGVESQAMVLASTSADGTTVELLDAPKGAKPGERCWFDTYPGTDFAQLNPKKKIWEGVQPRLRTDHLRRAVYSVQVAGIRTNSVLRCASGEVTVRTIVDGSINEHAKELGNSVPKEPFFFLKPTSSYIKAPEAIEIPKGCNVHHEIELGIVIGKTGRDISPKNFEDYIAGYVLAIDVTARDLQESAKNAGKPWSAAKGFDTFTPVGDFIEKSAIKDVNNLNLWLKVDDRVAQNGNTKDMVFKIPTLINYVSSIMKLEEGDLLLTGTPAGVGPMLPGSVVTAGLRVPGSTGDGMGF
ncbi:hypothetical protein HDU96_010828 [Phlyctochytrium bullatum]|nr:hypothetical protein HDU96_010828 [Phlyctochytrium bullatum]